MITMEQSVNNLHSDDIIDKLEYDKFNAKYNN